MRGRRGFEAHHSTDYPAVFFSFQMWQLYHLLINHIGRIGKKQSPGCKYQCIDMFRFGPCSALKNFTVVSTWKKKVVFFFLNINIWISNFTGKVIRSCSPGFAFLCGE
jgi:hypothetical protein